MKKLMPLCLLVFIFSVGCGKKPGVKWEAYTPELMAEARSSGQPVFAYFYAAWCPPCFELREKTYSDPDVIQALEPFRRIKIDLSFKHSEKIKAIVREYKIRGYPTIAFYDPDGNEDASFRFSGFEPPEPFLDRVNAFRSKYGVRDRVVAPTS